jgi:hypothetical protein
MVPSTPLAGVLRNDLPAPCAVRGMRARSRRARDAGIRPDVDQEAPSRGRVRLLAGDPGGSKHAIYRARSRYRGPRAVANTGCPPDPATVR